ncbi:MAG: LysR family transcriptional regulator [Acidimicrobiales bacterium]
MDLKQLRALLAVHEKASFSRAADLLGTVQSNVSAHVTKLENELGTVLIDRSTSRLTAEGEAVASRAYRMLGEMEAIWDDIGAFKAELSGTVRIGMIGTTARWITPRLYAALKKAHPAVRLVVHDGTSNTLNQLLTTGRLDLAVITLPVTSKDLTSTPLFTEEINLVVPRDNDPFPDVQSIEMTRLADLELLLPAPGTTFRNELDHAATTHNVNLRAAAELDGVRLIASLAFDGNGFALLPTSAVPAHLTDRVRLVKVNGIAPREVGMVWRTRSIPSASTKAVIALLQAVTSPVEHGQPVPKGVIPA